MSVQPEITQRDLRSRSKEIMDAVQGGQSFTVTRGGHRIGELVPLRRHRRFVPRSEFAAMSLTASDVSWGPSGPVRTPRPSRRRATPMRAEYAQVCSTPTSASCASGSIPRNCPSRWRSPPSSWRALRHRRGFDPRRPLQGKAPAQRVGALSLPGSIRGRRRAISAPSASEFPHANAPDGRGWSDGTAGLSNGGTRFPSRGVKRHRPHHQKRMRRPPPPRKGMAMSRPRQEVRRPSAGPPAGAGKQKVARDR